MQKIFGKLSDDVRANLAYFWSIISAVFIGYVTIKYGQEKEILTLLIGFVSGGIMGCIMGVYFNSSINKKEPTKDSDKEPINNSL